MHLLATPSLLLFALSLTASFARKKPEAVLLSSVQSLTLRKDLSTAHNRVSAVPQLKCIGGTAKGLYDIDVLRCKNQGSSYGDEDIQWTCTASLPSEFKLGGTDVICEGFSSPDDPYVLKGSCGVEYRLILTEIGEEKYRSKGNDLFRDYHGKGGGLVVYLFWAVFIVLVCWMIYAAFFRNNGPRAPRHPTFDSGGDHGGGGNDGPPPPYDYHPPPKKSKPYQSRYAPPAQAQEGWRPGFLTGALGGAAAGYLAGNRARNQQSEIPTSRLSSRNSRNWDSVENGEGASSGTRRSSGSSGPSYGSSRYESAGFGGTSRR